MNDPLTFEDTLKVMVEISKEYIGMLQILQQAYEEAKDPRAFDSILKHIRMSEAIKQTLEEEIGRG